MATDRMTSRRKRKLVVGVLSVGIVTSGLLAIALFYLGQTRPHF